MADEPKISQRYRELSREEPPRQLDDAILAASRRAVAGKKRQSWYVPLAAAAVIVLAVAVTVQVERERPNEEIALSQATPPPAAPAPAPAEQKAFVPDPKPAAPAQDATEALAKRSTAESRPLRREAAAPAAPAAQPQAERSAREAVVADARRADEAAMQERARSEAAASSRARASASIEAKPAPQAGAREGLTISAVAPPSPEQWLNGIADLRRQGRHEEADKALAEFRRLYPDYRVSEEMRAKIERGPVRAR